MLLALLAAGCSVGPDFLRPKTPETSSFTGAPLTHTASAKTRGGAAQKFTQGGDIPAEWWKQFGSKPLDALVSQSLKANPDLQAAEASLRQANENLAAFKGNLFPFFDAKASPQREEFSNAGFGNSTSPSKIFSLYNASVNVSYGLDFFGITRRGVESQAALADAQRYQYEAAYISLTSNVVTAAIREASLREQIRATKEGIEVERKQLKLLKDQLAAGGIAKSAVLAQQAQLSQQEATLPPLDKQLALTRDQLATYVGRLPSEKLEGEFTLGSLHLPAELPVSLPSRLVEQRPDVRAAEEQLHAANAQVGIAVSNMLPQVTLSADFGTSTGQTSRLFSPSAQVWSIAAGLAQPLFHGGQLLHQKRAAEAGRDRAAAQYRSTVLQAFQNVADTLRSLQYDADALATRARAEKTAADSLALAQDQYKAGAISYLATLDAQLAWQQARVGLAQAQAARYADTAALFQALGGGWWNRHAAAHTASDARKDKKTKAQAAAEEKHG
jgi:NodT family efflux transporter outer membrane factor (OMF) lipoprotein